MKPGDFRPCFCIVAVVAGLGLPLATAATPAPLPFRHEIGFSTSSGTLSVQGANATVRVSGGYGLLLNQNLELSVSTALTALSSSTTSSTSFDLLAGPRVNIPLEDGDLRNAAFAEVLVGFAAASVDTGYMTGSANQFAYAFRGGKRFHLGGSALSYSPSVSLVKVGNSDPAIAVVPLSFSALF